MPSYLLVQKHKDLDEDRVNEENEDALTWFVVGYLNNNIWTPEKDYQRSFAQERHGPVKKLNNLNHYEKKKIILTTITFLEKS